MTHGLTAVKEMHLDDYAELFQQAGLNAVIDPSRAGPLR
jgi:hypothetical protein